MLRLIKRIVLLIILSCMTSGFAENAGPLNVIARVTADNIEFFPNVIPENTPFIIHVVNNSKLPVELENSDTSVEIYENMDKTFKVGLVAGDYIFFNDFNPKSKKATLLIRPANTLQHKNIAPKPVPYAYSSSHLNISEILFVIWRESVEAFLVIGVVYNWLTQLKSSRRSGFVSLWIGIGLGLCFAIILSFLLIKVTDILPRDFSIFFQASITFVATIMIVYMVKWMRKNSGMLKSNMHHSLEKPASIRWRNISILTVVSVAFAREASEASIFIYALGIGNTHLTFIKVLALLISGLFLAAMTIFILQLGNKILSWKFFFKCTEILLLLLGGGLLLNCIDSLILSGLLTPLYTKIWDTSFLINEGGLLSPILSSFTGYRAAPSLMDVIAYSIYWLVIYFLFRTKKGNKHAI